MTIRTNTIMQDLIALDVRADCQDRALPVALLRELARSEFGEVGELVTFTEAEPLQTGKLNDLTATECLLNKWQMDEYVSDPSISLEDLTRIGVCFAFALQAKLAQSPIRAELRIIVSCNSALDETLPNTCTVRFHRVRLGNPWLRDNLEGYTPEGVLTLDWRNG